MFWKCRCCNSFITHRLYDSATPPVRQWFADQAGEYTPRLGVEDEFDVRDMQVHLSSEAIYVSADNSDLSGNLVRYDLDGNSIWRSAYQPTDQSDAIPHDNRLGIKADGTAVANVRDRNIYVLEATDGALRWVTALPSSPTRNLGIVWDGDDPIITTHNLVRKYSGVDGSLIWNTDISSSSGGPIPTGDNNIARWTNAVLVDGVLYQLYIAPFTGPFTAYLIGIDPGTGIASIVASKALGTAFPGIAYFSSSVLFTVKFRLLSYGDGEFGVGYAVGSSSSWSIWRLTRFDDTLSVIASANYNHIRDYDATEDGKTYVLESVAAGNVSGANFGGPPAKLYRLDSGYAEEYEHTISASVQSAEIVRDCDGAPLVGGPRVSEEDSE